MNGRISTVAALAALTLCTPLAARAQATPTYYAPPKLARHGKNTSAIAGKGVVVVQVLVNKNGSFKVSKVLRSTNSSDNKAALEIARTSTYTPASRGSQKLTAFYDYSLRFTSSGAASADQGSQGGAAGVGSRAGGAAKFEAMMRAGNYSGAQSGLRSYVADHPSDTRAQLELGIANTFLSDYAGAVDAFDKAGTIPNDAKGPAAKAYAENASALAKSGQNDKAVVSAKRAAELAPNFFTFNNLGSVEAAAGTNDAALADLEKARSLAGSTPHITGKERAQLDQNLEATYLANKDLDKAKAVAAEATQLDPGSDAPANIMANYYLKQSQALSQAGKASDAAALLESAAASAPKAAQTRLYAQAAFAYLNAQPKPVNDKAKADADKALALSPDDPQANFAEGVALANTGNSKDALTYLNKADAAAKQAGNTQMATSIESVIKQLASKS